MFEGRGVFARARNRNYKWNESGFFPKSLPAKLGLRIGQLGAGLPGCIVRFRKCIPLHMAQNNRAWGSVLSLPGGSLMKKLLATWLLGDFGASGFWLSV
jgi:hypothetical protein